MTLRTLVEWIAGTLEPLRWRKHRREATEAIVTERFRLRLKNTRLQQEARVRQQREDAERQLRLIESLFDNLRDIDERRSSDLRALAAGVTKQAEGFQEWIKLFAQTPGDPVSSTVRDEDEWLAEQQKFTEQLQKLGYPVAEDPMTQLDFLLADH